MPDNNFRSHQRDLLPREAVDPASEANDPLAELARLIGQTDPYLESRHSEPRDPARTDEAEAHGQDWAAGEEDYAEEHAEDRYDPPVPAVPAPASHPSYAPQDRGYEDEPPPGRYFSGSAAQFDGFREPPRHEYREEPLPATRARDLPSYATADDEHDYADEPEPADGEAYEDEYYEEPPRRRSAVIVVMAVLALAVVGTAGAFGYRAMFGGSMLPTLPPIIKASNGPIKVAPNYGEGQTSKSSQTPTANGSSSETLVSREEQPVNMEPPKPARVVASIPVIGGQSAVQPPMPATSSPGSAAASAAPAPQWPAPPPTPAAAPAAPVSTSAPTPAQPSTEPKRIHTVTIRPDQTAAPSAAPPPQPAATAPRPSARPVPPPRRSGASATAPPPGANAPLSIVPGGQGEAAPSVPVRTHTAVAPMSVASAAPVARAAPSSGGYAVQITSQRSEAEAQASFRELRAKFPNQLSGREPIIRRADLGAKGTYYRALVGPFASAEQAAAVCSGLKAAGGNCLVQKN